MQSCIQKFMLGGANHEQVGFIVADINFISETCVLICSTGSKDPPPPAPLKYTPVHVHAIAIIIHVHNKMTFPDVLLLTNDTNTQLLSLPWHLSTVSTSTDRFLFFGTELEERVLELVSNSCSDFVMSLCWFLYCVITSISEGLAPN